MKITSSANMKGMRFRRHRRWLLPKQAVAAAPYAAGSQGSGND
jgi:hypothetical protein